MPGWMAGKVRDGAEHRNEIDIRGRWDGTVCVMECGGKSARRRLLSGTECQGALRALGKRHGARRAGFEPHSKAPPTDLGVGAVDNFSLTRFLGGCPVGG